MAIKIARNEQGNCINFYGSSNPTHWNACLSGQVDPQNSDLVNIVNDITTSQAGSTQYEFFNIPYTEFLDEESNTFANAQEVADYITLKGNVTIGTGVTYKGIWNPDTNTPDITTDVSIFTNGDFYNVTSNGTHDLGSGDVDFINGDEVIFDGTDWQRKPYAGALIEYDSTSILLNNNAAVYADGAQGLEEPNGAEDGWYFKNDEAGKKINWYYVGNENAGYQMNKSTLQGGYVRLKVLTTMGSDSPFFSLYTTPKGDGYDAFWFRSRYVYSGDFSSISVNQEVIAYWGEDPSVSPELSRVQLSLDNTFSLLSTAPDISEDSIYTMSLSTNSAATVDSLEFIAKELGYKNQQYLRSYLLEAKLENIVVPQNDNDLTGEVIDFKLDDTSTSIMLDNGYAYGVNTIKAVDTGDGLITIKSMQGDLEHWIKLDHTNVTVNGESVSGGLNDVINTLNELYTVGAFQSVVISDPYSTMIADVDGVVTTETTAAQGTAIETGTDEYGATTAGYNAGGYKTPETINQAGEYFTFDIRNEGTIGFGLIPSDADYANGDFNGNSSYADPSSFCNGPNSGHYGYQFSHWFHPSPNGPWTNYGANTSYSMREGWSNATYRFSGSPEGAKWLAGDLVKIKVGIDENNFIVISYFDESTSLFVPIARTSYPVPNGLEYHLGIKFGDTTVRLVGLPKIHELEDLAPTMNFRYVESPDGVFNYPLFATEEEANYYDLTEGGSGTSHSHVYVDDPTNTNWYMPDTNSTMTASVMPTNAQTFEGNAINWTEITTLTNADLVPAAYPDTTITVDELSLVNYQVSPVDVGYVTTIGGAPNWSIVDNTTVRGNAPEVTGDNVANPSDTTTVTIYRTNSYGTSQGTLTINITNLTAPIVTPIAGVTDEGGTALIDSDTMDDGSAISIDNVVNVGNRFTFDKEWLDNYVLPKIASGTGAKAVYIGFPKSNANWSSVSMGDYLLGYQFYSDDTTRAANNWKLRVLVDGVIHYNVGIGGQTSGLYDYALINDGADISIGSLVASQGLNISTYVYNFSGVDANWKYTGGLTGVTSSNRDIVISTSGTDMDIDLQYFNEYTEPVPPVGNLTSWDKALDFSGGSEYAKQVSNYSYANALSMGFTGTTVPVHTTDASKTSNHFYSRPWAVTTVFKSDGNNSNQHIWNYGEGASNNNDNIYLRTNQFGALYFGWGREGVGVNEYLIASNLGSAAWYGVYIGYKGARFSASDATAANLASQFDIRLMFYSGGSWIFNPNPNYGNQGTWTSTGARMDRSIGGHLTIGGRGANRNFHGKVASMVVTTLVADRYLPTTNQIEKMITDPQKWLQNFKVGNEYRIPTYQYPQTGSNAFAMNGVNENTSTQVWLMGDGSYDSYSNGIRNIVKPAEQNLTKLQLNSMVSSDIETVNISGLT